jgi:hypothetical protein
LLQRVAKAHTLPCEVTGDITLELFQRTKNANSFVFFLGDLPPTIHCSAARRSMARRKRFVQASAGATSEMPEAASDCLRHRRSATGYFNPNWNPMVVPSFSLISYT